MSTAYDKRVTLPQSDLQAYALRGWLVCSPFSAAEIANIKNWVDEVQSWDNSGGWLHYREMTNDGPKLCRTENFAHFHEELNSLLTSDPILGIVSELMSEPALLYKEKINYKLVGGAGFAPHQDAPAYPFIQQSISCMIAVDASNVANGCLEVVDEEHSVLLPMNDRGCIIDEWVDNHSWHPVEMNPGDVLFFDSHTPHRSGTNTSQHDRRAMYPTFNAASEGNLHDDYYAEKLRIFRETEHTGSTVRISLIDDFEGRPV